LSEKEQWVIDYLKNKKYLAFVDMLDEDFVCAFIEIFDAKAENMTVGSPKCKELSNLLSTMYKKKLLIRFPQGVKSGYNQDCRNFKAPKWVYAYELPKEMRL
jgi:Uri superfamily endonuclease